MRVWELGERPPPVDPLRIYPRRATVAAAVSATAACVQQGVNCLVLCYALIRRVSGCRVCTWISHLSNVNFLIDRVTLCT